MRLLQGRSIAFVTDNFQVGLESGYGGTQYLAGLINRLRAVDIRCEVVARGHEQPGGVIGIGPAYRKRGQIEKLSFSRHLWRERAIFATVDLIHSQSASSIPFLSRMRRLGKPTIYDCRTSLLRSTHLLSAFHLASLTLFRPSELLVCDHASAADSLRLLRRPAHFLPVPVEGGQRPSHHLAPRIQDVAFASQLTAEKGFREVLAAFTRLWREGATIRLHIVGDGPLRREAEDLAARLPNNVILHGLLSPKSAREVISNVDLLIHPSRTESVSRSVLDAMSLGVPAVATNVGGMGELAEKDLFEVIAQHQPQSIAVAIRRLDNDLARRLDLSRRASAYVAKHHSWELVIDGLTALYSSVGALAGPVETVH